MQHLNVEVIPNKENTSLLNEGTTCWDKIKKWKEELGLMTMINLVLLPISLYLAITTLDYLLFYEEPQSEEADDDVVDKTQQTVDICGVVSGLVSIITVLISVLRYAYNIMSRKFKSKLNLALTIAMLIVIYGFLFSVSYLGHLVYTDVLALTLAKTLFQTLLVLASIILMVLFKCDVITVENRALQLIVDKDFYITDTKV